MLWSHVLTSLVANLISLVVVVLVALLMGFRSGAGALAWLAIAGILVLFTLALTWIAVIPGLSAKTADGAGAFSYPIVFLPFISSAFVPTHTMPGPVRAFADNQPVTSIANTIRDLFTQQPVSSGSGSPSPGASASSSSPTPSPWPPTAARSPEDGLGQALCPTFNSFYALETDQWSSRTVAQMGMPGARSLRLSVPTVSARVSMESVASTLARLIASQVAVTRADLVRVTGLAR